MPLRSLCARTAQMKIILDAVELFLLRCCNTGELRTPISTMKGTQFILEHNINNLHFIPIRVNAYINPK